MKNLIKVLSLVILSLLLSCNTQPASYNEADQPTNPDNPQPDILLLMHNPKGIRIEYNITRQELELWISPQAGKESVYWIRNFSNRDDHTRLFDRISFPALSVKDYKRVNYDPWHSSILFENQEMHIAMAHDRPVVMVWFEQDELVDLKSDKSDTIGTRTDQMFHMVHPDRGLEFDFVAATRNGQFRHQLQTDRGRSTYARCILKAGEKLFIGGELTKEIISESIEEMLSVPAEELIAAANEWTDGIIENGQVELRESDSLEQMVNFNKRIWVSSQDLSGALHASIKRIYYLIWVREGGLACPWMSYSGWVHPLEEWTRFQLQNPTEIHDEGPGGRFFGQLTNGKITKWQEDGTFYATWCAFTHWTQTGSREFITSENLEVLRESMDWLERYCFDEEEGIFYRHYFCETPLYNSRDFGWDNAVGKPVYQWDPPPYQGKKIELSYDIYINTLNYSVYRMLESMCNASGIENNYGEKAKMLAEHMAGFFLNPGLPDYGRVIATDGTVLRSEPYGMDRTDYIWALTCPPFYPDYVDIDKYRNLLFDDLLEKKDQYFLAAYFSILGSLDLRQVDQSDLEWAFNYAAKECYVPWENLPMAGSMVEMSGYYPPGHGHQIRPQMFTMGAWFGAMGNLAVHRLPFGIAAQPGVLAKGIKNYSYKGNTIQFSINGSGKNCHININGTDVANSLQVPEGLLEDGNNTVVVELVDASLSGPLLISSSMQLKDISRSDRKIKYHFDCFVPGNTAQFQGIQGKDSLEISDDNGTPVAFNFIHLDSGDRKITFDARGSVIIAVNIN